MLMRRQTMTLTPKKMIIFLSTFHKSMRYPLISDKIIYCHVAKRMYVKSLCCCTLLLWVSNEQKRYEIQFLSTSCHTSQKGVVHKSQCIKPTTTSPKVEVTSTFSTGWSIQKWQKEKMVENRIYLVGRSSSNHHLCNALGMLLLSFAINPLRARYFLIFVQCACQREILDVLHPF